MLKIRKNRELTEVKIVIQIEKFIILKTDYVACYFCGFKNFK